MGAAAERICKEDMKEEVGGTRQTREIASSRRLADS